jgi:uncharacterized protein
LLRHPALPYVAPFAIFLGLLVLTRQISFGWWEFPLWLAVMGAVIWWFSRDVIEFRSPHWAASAAMGIAVFAVWVAPDLLVSGYRGHWLFQNSITGELSSTLAPHLRGDVWVLLFRTLRAALIVPVVEELFWRGWLMRWLIDGDFRKVPLGAYTPFSFWITALLFAAEHGPYWEVGLLAGIAYNWWIVRTRSLGACMVAHGVTNAVLCVFVILTGRWELWF